MDVIPSRAPVDGEGFNPNDEFVVLFNLNLAESERSGRVALLSLVWKAPVLPSRADIIHVGTAGTDLVIKINDKVRDLSWHEGSAVQIDATLLHLRKPVEVLERVQSQIDDHPEYRAKLKVALHIVTSAELLAELHGATAA